MMMIQSVTREVLVTGSSPAPWRIHHGGSEHRPHRSFRPFDRSAGTRDMRRRFLVPRTDRDL